MSLFGFVKDLFSRDTQPATAGANTTDVIVDSASHMLKELYTVPVYTYNIGDLAEKYETPNRGVGYISEGNKWGDPGGDSYGAYQIETNKGTMKAYLNYKDKYTAELRKFVVNSQGFKDKWKELANKDPHGFQQSQFDFIATHSYYPAIADAKNRGWPVNSFALQSAIFSTSNQSGGWKNGIHAKAGIKAGDDLVTVINKYYDAREAYFRSLSLSNNIKRNIIKSRTVDERADCIALVAKEMK